MPRRWIGAAEGSSAVEFALLSPLLFLVVLGALYLALYLGTAHSLAQIAADISRYAMVGQDEGERRALAERWAARAGSGYPLLDVRRMSVTTSEVDEMMRVSVAYDMSYLPLPSFLRASVDVPSTLVRTAAVFVP